MVAPSGADSKQKLGEAYCSVGALNAAEDKPLNKEQGIDQSQNVELSVCVFPIIDGQHEHNPLGGVHGVEDSIRTCSVSPSWGRVIL